jgi:hypothetical protein
MAGVVMAGAVMAGAVMAGVVMAGARAGGRGGDGERRENGRGGDAELASEHEVSHTAAGRSASRCPVEWSGHDVQAVPTAMAGGR